MSKLKGVIFNFVSIPLYVIFLIISSNLIVSFSFIFQNDVVLVNLMVYMDWMGRTTLQTNES